MVLFIAILAPLFQLPFALDMGWYLPLNVCLICMLLSLSHLNYDNCSAGTVSNAKFTECKLRSAILLRFIITLFHLRLSKINEQCSHLITPTYINLLFNFVDRTSPSYVGCTIAFWNGFELTTTLVGYL